MQLPFPKQQNKYMNYHILGFPENARRQITKAGFDVSAMNCNAEQHFGLQSKLFAIFY